MKAALIAIGIAVLAAALAGGKFIGTRTELLNERDGVSSEWAQVDQAIGQRAELAPGLATRAASLAPRETAAIEGISKARADIAAGHTPQEKMDANQELDRAIGEILVVAENYPHLRTDGEFLRIQDELADAENRIAVERRKYNEALERYNTLIELFPANMVAAVSGFARNDAYFKTDAGVKATKAPL